MCAYNERKGGIGRWDFRSRKIWMHTKACSDRLQDMDGDRAMHGSKCLKWCSSLQKHSRCRSNPSPAIAAADLSFNKRFFKTSHYLFSFSPQLSFRLRPLVVFSAAVLSPWYNSSTRKMFISEELLYQHTRRWVQVKVLASPFSSPRLPSEGKLGIGYVYKYFDYFRCIFVRGTVCGLLPEYCARLVTAIIRTSCRYGPWFMMARPRRRRDLLFDNLRASSSEPCVLGKLMFGLAWHWTSYISLSSTPSNQSYRVPVLFERALCLKRINIQLSLCALVSWKKTRTLRRCYVSGARIQLDPTS